MVCGGSTPLGMNLQQRLPDGYARFGTGPTDPQPKRQGVGRSRGPQPPTEAADGAWGQPWRQASRTAGGGRPQAAAPGLKRPVPGSSRFHDPAPRRRGTKVKDASGAKRRNSRVFTFVRTLGNLVTLTRPS